MLDYGNQRGEDQELRVVECTKLTKFNPDWFVSAVKQPKYKRNDRNGIDVIINTTDFGPIYVQVKSSESAARRFAQKRPNRLKKIVVVVVEDSDSDEQLHQKLFKVVGQMRKKYLQKKHKKR